jgi:hypothetical protein
MVWVLLTRTILVNTAEMSTLYGAPSLPAFILSGRCNDIYHGRRRRICWRPSARSTSSTARPTATRFGRAPPPPPTPTHPLACVVHTETAGSYEAGLAIVAMSQCHNAIQYQLLAPATLSFMFISGVPPEKARLDTAGAIKVNVYVKLIHCYQSSSGRPNTSLAPATPFCARRT